MKKNRKKIFIFVLLLCTIFSTLFVLTPNVKAVVGNSTLDAGTYIANDTLTYDSSIYQEDFNFISNGIQYNTIKYGQVSEEQSYYYYDGSSGSDAVYGFGSISGWQIQNYKTILIESAQTVSMDFWGWFLANFDKQEVNSDIPTDLTGYTVTVPANWTATSGYGQFNITGEFNNEYQSLLFSIGYSVGGTTLTQYVSTANFVSIGEDAFPYFTFNNSTELIFNVTGGSDVTNQMLIQWLVNNNATFDNGSVVPSGYNVTLEQGSNSLDFSLFAVGEVLYQINETGYNVPIYTNATPLPYTIEEVESIQFINNSTDYRLLVYQDASTYYSIEPGNSSLLYSITADKTYDLELVQISTTPTTYTISGGYQFYPTISSSIFGDTSEQELDILLEGNFWLYGNENVQWDMFTLHTLSSEDTALYFCYESSIFNKYNYVGQLINNNTQIQTYVGERTIYFEEQEVSEDVYNWLNNNGRFGNYDDTLPTPAPDNPFGFVVDMVNDFLQIEFLPGFKFIHLLYIAISIPLLMYILKLFLGG